MSTLGEVSELEAGSQCQAAVWPLKQGRQLGAQEPLPASPGFHDHNLPF